MICQKCGNEIPGEAIFCPKCGEKANNTLNNSANNDLNLNKNEAAEEKSIGKTLRLVGSIIVAVIIIFLLIKEYSDPYRNILNIDNMRDAYALAQEVIIENISTPSSAKFPDFTPDYVTQGTEHIEYDGQEFYVHTVSAYVDYQNLFGTEVRSNFVIKVGRPIGESSDNYYYEIVSID